MNKLKGDSFSIAYFVGSTDSEFPSHNYSIINKIRNSNSKEKGKIIDVCPLCGGDIYLGVDEEQVLVVHKCEKCKKVFRLYYSDDEIYRTLPTFIISTVDKLAGIGSNRRFKNLLGGHLDKCFNGHGFIPRGDTCDFRFRKREVCKQLGTPVHVDFDTGPTLMIQDEMHLISEGFGTIDSHFESLIEAMKMEFSEGVKFKHIAMSATVSGANTQIKHLYHKKTRLFPPSLNNGEFFFKKEIEDDKFITQRKIIGLKRDTNANFLLLIILKYISQFIRNVENDKQNFAIKHDFNLKDLNKVIKHYKKLLTYHNKKLDVHKVSYNIHDLVNETNSREPLYEIVTKTLTGDDDTNYIKDIINQVKTFYDNEENKEKLFVVSATSIVSHGVDIDEWNIMIFNGMTRNTAEYIQALSRVGRKHFGIVFVLLDSIKMRDTSFYQNFIEYHKLLNYKIEEVPLSRWTKLGFKQTFTSLFCAGVLNYLSNVLETPIYSLDQFKDTFLDTNNKKRLIDFLKKAYISNSDMLGADYFDKQIPKEVDKRLKYIEGFSEDTPFFPNALKKCKDKYFRTQHGMRGIQDQLVLAPDRKDYNFKSLKRRR